MKKIRFEADEQRFYTTPKGWMPSVTTVLKPIKQIPIAWSAKMTGIEMGLVLTDIANGLILPEHLDKKTIEGLVKEAKAAWRRDSDKGKDIGTRVHAWIDEFYRAKKSGKGISAGAELTEDMIKPVKAFIDWDRENEVVPIETEKFVWSSAGFAGSFDLFCTIKGVPALCDFKASKIHAPENSMQLAAYSMAWFERGGQEPEKWIILRLDKETGVCDPKEFSAEEIMSARKRFLYLLDYWKETNRGLDIEALAKEKMED